MSCDEITPFQLLIRDVQVVPRTPGSLMKGIAASIGASPQNIAVLPWLQDLLEISDISLTIGDRDLNKTWTYDPRIYCDNSVVWNDVICRIRHGNYYEEGNLSSWVKAYNIAVASGASTEAQPQGEEDGVGELVASRLA
ncbi:hypothetical protein F5Y05DRAFT_313047 [Hypoxylon sp. FL0543]|nr:hypothetical protein F5Y05DRAFT_313047 [Hypoxylon sp. FL0543]